MASYLDKSGLTTLWSKINSKFLPLGGGTLTGALNLSWSGTEDVSETTTNPRIIFSATDTQPVGLVYSYHDAYRKPYGLKVMAMDSSGGAPWFEVEGDLFTGGKATIGSSLEVTGGGTFGGILYKKGSGSTVTVGYAIGSESTPELVSILLDTNGTTYNRLGFRQYGTNGNRENFNLPQTTAPEANANYYILTTKTAVTLAQGGTGATSRSDAWANIVAPGGAFKAPITLIGTKYSYHADATSYGLDCNNSDIIKVNSIYTADASESFNESFNFYRDGTIWDKFTAAKGIFYFGAGVAADSSTLRGSAELRAKQYTITPSTSNTQCGYLSVTTEGTATTEGIAKMVIGNNTAKGTANNCTGNVVIYGPKTYYCALNFNTGAANKSIDLAKVPTATWTSSTSTLAFTM